MSSDAPVIVVPRVAMTITGVSSAALTVSMYMLQVGIS